MDDNTTVYLTESGAWQCIDPNPEKYVGLPLEARNGRSGVHDLYDLKGALFAAIVDDDGFSETPTVTPEQVAEACKNYKELKGYEAYPGNKRRA